MLRKQPAGTSPAPGTTDARFLSAASALATVRLVGVPSMSKKNT
jgi:hypothetical protein